MFALPLDRHVLLRIDAVLGEDVVQRIFRRRALAAGVNRLAAQILHAADAVAALHDVEHAQRVDGQHLNLSFRVVVKHGGQIRRHGGNVRLALDQLRGNLVHRGSNRDIVGVAVHRAALGLVHQLHHAHRRRALQRRHAHVRFGQRRAGHQHGRRTDRRPNLLHHENHPFFVRYSVVLV